jgi:hypothetical protein
MSGWIERVAYGISKGFFEAYFDVIRKQREVHPEEATDEDLERADRFGAAARRVLAERRERSEPSDPAPADPADVGDDSGSGT